MPKPVCVPCQRFFRPHRTGSYWTEMMPTVSGARPGTEEPENWQPYKVWSGDTFRCKGCGATIVVGHGQQPVAEQHHSDFEHLQKSLRADKVLINDC